MRRLVGNREGKGTERRLQIEHIAQVFWEQAACIRKIGNMALHTTGTHSTHHQHGRQRCHRLPFLSSPPFQEGREKGEEKEERQ